MPQQLVLFPQLVEVGGSYLWLSMKTTLLCDWGPGTVYSRDAGCCPAAHFHPLIVLWRGRLGNQSPDDQCLRDTTVTACALLRRARPPPLSEQQKVLFPSNFVLLALISQRCVCVCVLGPDAPPLVHHTLNTAFSVMGDVFNPSTTASWKSCTRLLSSILVASCPMGACGPAYQLLPPCSPSPSAHTSHIAVAHGQRTMLSGILKV